MSDSLSLNLPIRCSCGWSHRNNINTSSQEYLSLLGVSSTNHRNSLQTLWLVCLGLILVVGLTTGVYLLCREGEEETFTGTILIRKTEWDTFSPEQNITELKFPVDKVEIFTILSSTIRCDNDTNCDLLPKSIQAEHMNATEETDILSNFLLDNDGRLYEDQGWTYVSGARTDGANILYIGIVGNPGDISVSKKQAGTITAFLEFAVAQKKLIPCFQVVMDRLEENKLKQEIYDILKMRRKC
ncbi:peptidoglycan recognition protein [Leptinotarsa decemlineata]|uniref:peptidoglycan recognition protein n=1 Tax=Leptinotarsa decemlineata TaxID=7539 RepID=UPI003D30C1E1